MTAMFHISQTKQLFSVRTIKLNNIVYKDCVRKMDPIREQHAVCVA